MAKSSYRGCDASLYLVADFWTLNKGKQAVTALNISFTGKTMPFWQAEKWILMGGIWVYIL